MDSGHEVDGEPIKRVAIRRKFFNRLNMRSIALRLRYKRGQKQLFQRRFTFGGMLGAAPLASIFRRTALVS